MKTKKNLIIALLIVLLGIVTLVVVLSRSRNHTFKQDFQIEAAGYPGAVSKIFMADKENHQVKLHHLNSHHQEHGIWMNHLDIDNRVNPQ